MITSRCAITLALCIAGITATGACDSGRHAAKGAERPHGCLARAARDTVTVADLPLVEVPAAATGHVLAVLITGDGGWADADRGLSGALAARGVPVVGLRSPSYLANGRAPDETARDLARILRHYFATWGCDSAVVIGYSRGADLAPFMVSRLPNDLRGRVALVALLGPSRWAGFQYHVVDLVANVHRAADLSVASEVQRLRGTPVLCIYGRGDHNAICPALDPALARPVLRDGGHGVDGREGPALADTMLRAIGTTTRRGVP